LPLVFDGRSKVSKILSQSSAVLAPAERFHAYGDVADLEFLSGPKPSLLCQVLNVELYGVFTDDWCDSINRKVVRVMRNLQRLVAAQSGRPRCSPCEVLEVAMRTPRRDFYGRRPNSKVWHFHRECPHYPPYDGSVFKQKRPAGPIKLCKKCLAMERRK
jgi:hypothetical protein